jgi:hypothetical protein
VDGDDYGQCLVDANNDPVVQGMSAICVSACDNTLVVGPGGPALNRVQIYDPQVWCDNSGSRCSYTTSEQGYGNPTGTVIGTTPWKQCVAGP